MKELINDIRNTSTLLKNFIFSYALLLAFGTETNPINIVINQVIIWVIIPGLFLNTITKNNLHDLPKEFKYFFTLIVFFVLCLPIIENTDRFFWAIRKCIMALMMFIIIFRLMQNEHSALNLLFLSIFIGTLIFCVMNYANIETAEVFIGDDFTRQYVTKIGGENTVNTNGLASIAVNGIMATLFLIHAYPRLKWVFLSLAVIYVIIVIACASKSGFLSMLLTIVLWYITVYSANSRFKGINLLLLAVVSYLVFIYFADLLEGTYLLTRFNEIDSLNKYYEKDSRGVLIQQGLEVFLDYPVIGVGLGQIGLYTKGAYTHNDIVEILSNGGIIGAFLYFSFLVIIFRRTIFVHKFLEKAGKQTHHVRFLKILFIVMMVRGISVPLFVSFDEMFMIGIVSSYSYITLHRYRETASLSTITAPALTE
jgi:O-antigen ligase